VQPRLCSALHKASITEQQSSCCIVQIIRIKVAPLKKTKDGSSTSPSLSSPTLCDVGFRRTERS
jgi:hypothetical protein